MPVEMERTVRADWRIVGGRRVREEGRETRKLSSNRAVRGRLECQNASLV